MVVHEVRRMSWFSRIIMAGTVAVALASSAVAQNGSKVVFAAAANGQTGAMQTGARASGVTLTFCGTGFSGDLYVDAAATSSALAQVWTTALTANSDCTTTYAHSPASKWYRVRWTRSAGKLDVWMSIRQGEVTPGGLTGPVGGLTAGRVVLSGGATQVSDDAGLQYDPTTDTLKVASLTQGQVVRAGADGTLVSDNDLIYTVATKSLDVTDGRVQAGNIKAIPLPASGAVTVAPKLSPLGGITVVAGSALVDGDSLSVGDGVGVVPLEFDAAPGDGTTGGAVPIIFDGTETATQIRDAVKAILDASGRDWITSAQGADGIGLVRATPGASGGAITEAVSDAGFTVNDWTAPTAATTYTYSLQACLADGTCNAAGAASSTAAGVLTLSGYNLNRLSWSAVTGAASYKIRRDVGGATQGVIWSGTALTVDDTGLAGDSTPKPTVDGTGTVTADRVVAGGGTFTGPLLIPSGTVSAPGLALSADPDTGLYFDGTRQWLTFGGIASVSWSNQHLRLGPGAYQIAFLNNTSNTLTFRLTHGFSLGNDFTATAPTFGLYGANAITTANLAGADLPVGPGLGTGDAVGSAFRIKTPSKGSSGATAQTREDRVVVNEDQSQIINRLRLGNATYGTIVRTGAKTLTDAADTALVDINVPAGMGAAGKLGWTAVVTGGSSDVQTVRGEADFATANKGGTMAVDIKIGTGDGSHLVDVLTDGTCTVVATNVSGTAKSTLTLNVDTSLSDPIITVYWWVLLDGSPGISDTPA
jgi:hypothetical protein